MRTNFSLLLPPTARQVALALHLKSVAAAGLTHTLAATLWQILGTAVCCCCLGSWRSTTAGVAWRSTLLTAAVAGIDWSMAWLSTLDIAVSWGK